MLAYSRCKTIGAQLQGEDHRVVSGVLEDELYAMQCELMVNRTTLTIEAVQTRMKRFTTSRCPLAQPVFQQITGWKIGPSIEGRIKKEIGRNGCRHMASLLIDCCRGFASAELAHALRSAVERDASLIHAEFLNDFRALHPQLAQYLGLGMS